MSIAMLETSARQQAGGLRMPVVAALLGGRVATASSEAERARQNFCV